MTKTLLWTVHETGIINEYSYSTKENDLFEMKQLLRECHRYFEDGSLKSDCENFKCFTPPKCMQFNAVYNILHFLADNKFNVSYSMILHPFYNFADKILLFSREQTT